MTKSINRLGADRSALRSHKNYMYNPEFVLWRKAGFSQTGLTGDTAVADRWSLGASTTTGVYTVERGTSAALPGSAGYLDVYATAAETDTTTNFAVIKQRFPGTDISSWGVGTDSAVTVTLSFWHRHTLAGKYYTAIREAGAARSLVLSYTQSVADEWERTEQTFQMDVAGTWVQGTRSAALELMWAVAGGQTFVTSPANDGVWQTGNFVSGSDNTDLNTVINQHYRLDRVKLEVGERGTEFESRSDNEEVAACNRFWRKSYDQDVVPGAATSPGAVAHDKPTPAFFTTVDFGPMIGTPSVTIYSTLTGTSGNADDGANEENIPLLWIGETGFALFKAATTIIGQLARFQWVADAEI